MTRAQRFRTFSNQRKMVDRVNKYFPLAAKRDKYKEKIHTSPVNCTVVNLLSIPDVPSKT